MTEEEQHKLFQIFDNSGDGLISFNEFLTAIVGKISANRKRLVQEAFNKLDSNGNGTLELQEVKDKFDPTRHPDVIHGIRSAEGVRSSFFEMFTKFQSAAKGFTGDRSVTLDEFIEYHQYFNNAFETDQAFKNFLVGVWNMDL